MIRTTVCDLLGIEHPIALRGMGSVFSPDLVLAVSNAGGLGTLGCHYLPSEQIRNATAAIRDKTNNPFGLNFLIFDMREEGFATALSLRPSVIAFAWPKNPAAAPTRQDLAFWGSLGCKNVRPDAPGGVADAEGHDNKVMDADGSRVPTITTSARVAVPTICRHSSPTCAISFERRRRNDDETRRDRRWHLSHLYPGARHQFPTRLQL